MVDPPRHEPDIMSGWATTIKPGEINSIRVFQAYIPKKKNYTEVQNVTKLQWFKI